MSKKIKLVLTEKDYDLALARIDELFDVKPGSKEFEEIELLMAKVEMYEHEHYMIDPPTSNKKRIIHKEIQKQPWAGFVKPKNKMETYIGVKMIHAKPMTYKDWYKYMNKNEELNNTSEDHEGYLVEYEQDPQSPNKNHPDHEGYISWSPKGVFEKAYILEKGSINIENVERPPHQQRVINEYVELLEKSNALIKFFDNPIFASLAKDEQLRLKNQSSVMKAYLSILVVRIEHFY